MALKPITKESTDRMACLVIGKAGIGKTSLIRTIPEGDKACVLSAEAGLLCVRDMVKAGKVEGYEIGSLDDFKEAYTLLLTNQEMQKRYQWIFIDSLTEIAARCEEVMQAKHTKASDTFKMWQDYTNTMIQLIKAFRDMTQYNVVFTCLETIDKDEDNRRYVAPMVSGKGLKEKLPSFFDEVFYFNTIVNDDGQQERKFFTQPINEYPAKDRSGKLELLEVPNLGTIKSKIFDDKEK